MAFCLSAVTVGVKPGTDAVPEAVIRNMLRMMSPPERISEKAHKKHVLPFFTAIIEKNNRFYYNDLYRILPKQP